MPLAKKKSGKSSARGRKSSTVKKNPKRGSITQKPVKKRMRNVGIQVSCEDINDLDTARKVSAFREYVEDTIATRENEDSNLLVSGHNFSDASDISIHSDDDMYTVPLKRESSPGPSTSSSSK
ncbi:hypothetical protein DMENIID0001_121130 [Sergentomyia squamirostris]